MISIMDTPPTSEGRCRKCGSDMDISGTCYACALNASLGPRCGVCGRPLIHNRLLGYRCSRDGRHEGIIR